MQQRVYKGDPPEYDDVVNSPSFKKRWKALEKGNPAIKKSHYIYGRRPDDPGMLTELGKLRHKLQYLKTDFEKGDIFFDGMSITVKTPTYWNENIGLDQINSRLRQLPVDIVRRLIEDACRYLTVQQEVDSGYRYDMRENR
ncbi:MAG: hypothetical protein RBU23_12655 [Candidatus Auribacterota bacterium]|jgi:hypothetical protein|nr:hypothetical protein [Candidatus Auribacterota bacterium]